MQKALYTELSFYDLAVTNFVRLVAVIAMGYLYSHYEENPPVIVVAMVFCFLVFLFMGNSLVLIYSDRLVVRDTSLAHYIFNRKGAIYQLADIKNAYLPDVTMQQPDPSDRTTINLLKLFLADFSRKEGFHGTNSQPILLQLKNGGEENLFLHFSKNKKQRIVTRLNALLQE